MPPLSSQGDVRTLSLRNQQTALTSPSIFTYIVPIIPRFLCCHPHALPLPFPLPSFRIPSPDTVFPLPRLLTEKPASLRLSMKTNRFFHFVFICCADFTRPPPDPPAPLFSRRCRTATVIPLWFIPLWSHRRSVMNNSDYTPPSHPPAVFPFLFAAVLPLLSGRNPSPRS